MKTTTRSGDKTPNTDDKTAAFEKRGECLYRYKPTGTYYAFYKVGGNKKRQSLETKDEKAAKRLLADKLNDRDRLDHSQAGLTLTKLCDKYLLTIRAQAPGTQDLKKAFVKRLLEDFPPGANCSVSKVKTSDLLAWVASYTFGYSPYNHYVQYLKALFNIAVEDKAIVLSPAAALKPKKVVTPVRVTPSYEEFNAIVANVRSQRFNAEAETSADYLEFMGLIGVGQAEASTIEKQHVKIAEKQLTFFRAKTKKPYFVPIFPQAEALITKLISRKDMKPTDLLFPVNMEKSMNARGSSKKDAKQALAAACKRLRYPLYTQRSLRRMFITRCIEKKIDVKVIAQWQGHSDGGKLILGTYSHVRNTHAEEMAKLLVA